MSSFLGGVFNWAFSKIVAGAVTLLTEAFTGTNGAAWPGQWTTSTSDGTATIQGNAGQFTCGSTLGAYTAYARALAAGMTPTADCEITGTVNFANAALEQFACAQMRVTSGWSGTDFATAAQGWRFTMAPSNNTVNIDEITGGVVSLKGSSPLTFSTGTWNFRFNCKGNVISAKVWQGGEPGPWTTQYTASGTNAQAGYVGVNILTGNAVALRTITFDTLQVVTV